MDTTAITMDNATKAYSSNTTPRMNKVYSISNLFLLKKNGLALSCILLKTMLCLHRMINKYIFHAIFQNYAWKSKQPWRCNNLKVSFYFNAVITTWWKTWSLRKFKLNYVLCNITNDISKSCYISWKYVFSRKHHDFTS